MTRLTILIDVPDDAVDPTLTDPLDLANDITGEYQEWAKHNDGIPIDVVTAEWAPE